MENYEVLKIIYDKSENELCLAKNKNNNITYFVKKIKKKSHKIRTYRREVLFLKKLNHENIIKYIDSFEDNEYAYIITEYINGEDLFSHLDGSIRLTESELKKILYSIAHCIKYIHEHNIAHGDIKPENIVVSKDLQQVKLIDFGLSSDCSTDNYKDAGTKYYLSPQFFLQSRFDLKKDDIWAYGVVIYVLFYYDFPFDDEKSSKQVSKEIEHIICNKQVIYNDDTVNPDINDLIKNILIKDDKKRYTINEILNHKWFNDLKNIK